MAELETAVETFPLSPTQEGLFFQWLLDRHSGTDVQQIEGDLLESIDPARMEGAWQRALDTIGALRTSFRWEGLASPVQRVEERVPVRFRYQDLRALHAEGREAVIEEFLRTDRREGFDLADAPSSRVQLFQLEERRFRMIWSFHHILIDGRSFADVLAEVFRCYGGQQTSEFVDRPYREYVDWVLRQDRTRAHAFWRAALDGFTAPTPIPTEAPADPPKESVRQAFARLDAEVSQRLRDLAVREGVTLNTLVMAAWAVLLARYGGERDVVFGVVRTTRRGSVPGAESMAGFFLATLPLRVRVDPDASVSALLGRVREAWVAMRGSEHLPLVDIKSASPVPAAEPLFRTLVAYDNQRLGSELRARGGEWLTRDFTMHQQTGLPIALQVYGEPALVFWIEYDPSRLTHASADRMLGHLATVLAAWARDASGPVWATPMLTTAERDVVLGAWQATERDYPADVPLARLVEEQVRRTPASPAVTFGDTTLSYAELNRRANQLARALRAQGAGPDTLVGLAVERSLEMMVALLAIIKSGAGYVPLDPAFPKDRLGFMIEDSGLGVLLTQSSLRASLPEFTGVTLDLDAPSWLGEPDTDLDVEVDPESIAVVIYTSGSTGKPKGVLTPRRALINLLWSMREWLALSERDRVLAITTISFDIAGADIWLPWLVGAHTIVASREAAADGATLRELLERHDVTFMQATPISWRQLMAAGWPGKPDLQTVCTGEAMPPEVAAFLVPRVRKLWNLYGPSETTIWSTGVVVDKPEGKVTIGRPVANTTCYLLDEHRQPVPAGVIGELYIGGVGLARGYLNRPELTAERFLPDPFSDEPGARMYRTGDLARFLPDGIIECLGRVDHQVKIRGFRIELGEIESALQDHPRIRQAVVVAREDGGEKRLVAYFTADGVPPEGAELREHLRRTLPEYMVPAVFMPLDRIPISPNGKVDRKALPAPVESAAPAARPIVRPRTHVEKQIAEIWEEAFGVTGLSVTDDFFDLRGHSILAVRIMAGIARVFGRKLPLNVLFEAPTIERLAAHVEDPDRTYGEHTLVSIQAMGSRPPIFWVPGGAALGFFRFQHIVSRLGPDQPVYGLGSRAPKSLAQIATVEQRAESYLELVRRVRPKGPYVFVGFCAGGLVALEMAQRMRAAGEEVVLLGLINCHYPGFATQPIRLAATRAQRLLHQIRRATANGVGLLGYVRRKVADRRAARADRDRLATMERQVQATGFTEHTDVSNEVLLAATTRVFGGYRPRDYEGRVTLFVSDEEDFRGVSAALDPRLAWRAHVAEWQTLTFPGDHQGATTDDAPAAGDFATVLKEAIDATPAAGRRK